MHYNTVFRSYIFPIIPSTHQHWTIMHVPVSLSVILNHVQGHRRVWVKMEPVLCFIWLECELSESGFSFSSIKLFSINNVLIKTPGLVCASVCSVWWYVWKKACTSTTSVTWRCCTPSVKRPTTQQALSPCPSPTRTASWLSQAASRWEKCKYLTQLTWWVLVVLCDLFVWWQSFSTLRLELCA